MTMAPFVFVPLSYVSDACSCAPLPGGVTYGLKVIGEALQ